LECPLWRLLISSRSVNKHGYHQNLVGIKLILPLARFAKKNIKMWIPTCNVYNKHVTLYQHYLISKGDNIKSYLFFNSLGKSYHVRRKGMGLCLYMGNECVYVLIWFPPSLLGFLGCTKLNTPYYCQLIWNLVGSIYGRSSINNNFDSMTHLPWFASIEAYVPNNEKKNWNRPIKPRFFENPLIPSSNDMDLSVFFKSNI
jgi:hypothetical protein